jgi:dienelactone hydrolase
VPTDGSEYLVPAPGAIPASPADQRNSDGLRETAGAGSETERGARARPSPLARQPNVFASCLIGCAILAVLVIGGLAVARWWMVLPTPFPPQKEDYVEARKHFHTRLLIEAPAPQEPRVPGPQRPPIGAMEVRYPSGKLRLKAWVSDEASGNRPYPAVLYLHGGFAFDPEDWMWAAPFRGAGYIVMTPVLRGENDLPGSYTMFYSEVDDVLAAADTLAAMPGVDSNHIYICGHSAGGTLTLLASMCSHRFRAAGSFSGSPDQLGWARIPENLQQAAKAKYGNFIPFDPSDRLEYQMRSPLAYPKSFKCPVRMYYATHDHETHLPQSCDKTAELARAAGLDVEAERVPGNHITAVPKEMARCIEFFRMH